MCVNLPVITNKKGTRKMKFDKFAVAITIQGILFCIFGVCTAYFGNKYFELKNKENVNILNLSGHRCIAVIKNNNVIDFHHNHLECDKCQKNTNTASQRDNNGPVHIGDSLESNIIGN